MIGGMFDRRDFLLACASVPLFASVRNDRSGFDPAIGVCRGVDAGHIAKAGGAAFLEVSCRGWLVPHRSDEEFAKRKALLLASPVPPRAANSFLPGSLRTTGPEADQAAVATYAERAFRRAAEVGIETITFGSSGSRSLPDGFPRSDAELQFTAVLARLAPLAGKHGVTLSVEPLQKRETNFINRVDEAARIVRAVQHPRVRITADIFHMMREGEGPASIAKAGDLIHHVHVAEKRERTAPGRDGDDFRPYLRALRDSDYRGRVSIESRWSDLAKELPVAVKALKEQLASLG